MGLAANHRLAYFDTSDGNRFPTIPRIRLENIPDGLITAAKMVAGVLPYSEFSTAPQRALRQRLHAKAGPAVVNLLGDSTGNDDTDWFVPVLGSLAAVHPEWTVRRRLWSDTDQGYARSIVVQVGSGGDSYVVPVAGGAGRTATTAQNPVGADAGFFCKIRTGAGGGGAEQAIGGQYGVTSGAGGDRSWYVFINATYNTMAFRMVNSAGTQVDYVATFANLSLSTDYYLGGWFTGSTGTFQPRISTDGVTWSNLGSGVTAATQTAFNDSTYAAQVGCRGAGSGVFDGRIYWFEALDTSISAPRVLWRFDAGMWVTGSSWTGDDGGAWSLGGTSTLTAQSPLLLAMNGSHPGATMAYAEDGTRQPKLIAAPANLTIFNWGHNQTETDVQSAYAALVNDIKTAWPSSGIAVCRQNPQDTGEANWARQNRHQSNIGELAAREGWGVIDGFQAFLDTGDPDTYILDGVHPTTAGYVLWSNVARRTFGLAEV